MATTTQSKGKIGVLIEDHFDPTEYREFNKFFPNRGYDVEYITHLWGNKSLTFGSNPEKATEGPDAGRETIKEHVTVTTEVNDIQPSDYKAIIGIGAYATDRLRYQEHPRKGQPNQAPAVEFLRKALKTDGLKIGTICHSLWLFCADPALLRGRKVTCANNIICDVENAGGEVIYDGDRAKDLVIDGNLISAQHPDYTQKFMEALVDQIEESPHA